MATITANTENPANKTFSQVLQKHAGRAKERLLQNLGRADKTKDEVFEVYLQNFSRQQLAVTKLQKEFKNYLLCIKSMQMASKSLMDTLSEIYEQEWVGHEQIPVKAQALDLLWDDYFRKMNDVLNPINNYIAQFHDMRNKIGKRGRKLVDYDKSRHNVEALRSSAKKKDDAKLTKAREELELAKSLYEQLNNELHEDLPHLYDSRIAFLVRNLQMLFDAECRFHGENAVVYQFLNETMHKLARDSGHPISGPMVQAPQLSPMPPCPSPLLPPQQQQNNNMATPAATPPTISLTSSGQHQPTPQQQPPQQPLANSGASSGSGNNSTNNKSASLRNSTGSAGSTKQPQQPHSFAVTSSAGGEVRPYEEIDFKKDGPGSMSSPNGGPSAVPNAQKSAMGLNGQRPTTAAAAADHGVYDIPKGATTTDLPAGTLYKVRATYKYTAEDVDELNFESGEVIRVIEYDDPEEQEEGWLMGVKEGTGEKGLFPANFTRPI